MTRFHLDGLVDAGLAERRSEVRTQPGRPRTVYVASAANVPAGQRSYRLLAVMLTSLVADSLPEPGRAAEAAGEAGGRYLAERPCSVAANRCRGGRAQVVDRARRRGLRPGPGARLG